MWGWFRRKSPAAIGADWDTSASKATRCCGFCWWKRRRSRCAANREWRSKFFHLAMRRGRKIAKVAMARKLAVHLYWMWRQGWDYGQLRKARFARGRARKSPWCAVNHRRNDWASRSPSQGSSK